MSDPPPDKADPGADAPAAGSSPLRRARPARIVELLAVAAAGALAVLLAVRPLASPDLGYHLAYGQHFLETGDLVDDADALYTVRRIQQSGQRPETAPGGWWDADGWYRFPNANWLSQIVMAGVYALAGAGGLCVLQAGLIAGIVALILAAARRLGAPWVLAALAVGLFAMTGYARFNLRPEVFAYLLLAGELFVLVRARFRRRDVAWLVILQMLLVNLHSYFLLGLALTTAVLADRLLRIAWTRAVRHVRADRTGGPAGGSGVRRDAALLGIALAGQVAVCFANPWTWRLAALPIQTLMFLRANDVAAAPGGSGHPWSLIGEFHRPFSPGGFLHTKATYAFAVVLGFGAAGLVAAAWKRRWDLVFILFGMASVALSMRRNIAPGAMVLAPVSLAALAVAVRPLWSRLHGRLRNALWIAAGAGVVTAAGVFIALVLTQRFYFAERTPWRFGWGFSRSMLPAHVTRWMSEHNAAGRLWTGYNSSSSVYGLTPDRPGVPILTNTWAYPPAVMSEVLTATRRPQAFASAAKRYGVQRVVLRVDGASAQVVRWLMVEPGWSLVALDARHVLFVRAAGPNADVATRFDITQRTFDVKEYLRRVAANDPVPASALHMGGTTLLCLGMMSPSIEVLEAAVAADPDYHEAWHMLGFVLVQRGNAHLGSPHLRGQTAGRADLVRARDAFRRCLEIAPDYEKARHNLALVRRQLDAVDRGLTRGLLR